MLPSYSKVYTIGHKAIADLFADPVVVQEKIDGSQITFGYVEGKLQIRSHHAEINPEYPMKLFIPAVETILDLKAELVEGWIYRGEYLAKPKHNTLTYDRIPKHHIILFDIVRGIENYIDYEDVVSEAKRLDLEVVPCFDQDFCFRNMEQLEELLKTESCLGGPIEGLVFKNYLRYGRDGHALMGKYVSETFREKHRNEWNRGGKKDLIEELAEQLRTEARWEKAIQHLNEQGLLSNEPKDIGPLLKEINRDVLEEEQDEIKERVFKWVWKKLSQELTKGFPEYYKSRLAQSVMERDTSVTDG